MSPMKLKNINLIIDFDSTLVKLEGLEELAQISLEGNPKRKEILDKMAKITKQGMSGEISFQESLQSRFSMFAPKRIHLEKLSNILSENISDSILENQKFFRANSSSIYIISGGFREWMMPTIHKLGLLEENLLANNFVCDLEGEIAGINEESLLTKSKGKAEVVKKLNLSGLTIIIGDGYTDYEIKKHGYADLFIAYEENIVRPEISKLADLTINSWDEFPTGELSLNHPNFAFLQA